MRERKNHTGWETGGIYRTKREAEPELARRNRRLKRHTWIIQRIEFRAAYNTKRKEWKYYN